MYKKTRRLKGNRGYLALLLGWFLWNPIQEAYGQAEEQTDGDISGVVHWLTVRHPEPDCGQVTAHTKQSLETLRKVIEQVQMPPWVPMRAARCLMIQHPKLGAKDMGKWVSRTEYKGLATLVFQQLDLLPKAVAVEVATQALKGPHKESAEAYIARSSQTEVQILVAELLD